MDVKKFTPLCLLVLFPLVCGLSDPLSLSSVKIRVNSNKKSFKDARDFCREHHTDLVRITSWFNSSTLLNVEGFIGINRKDKDSQWKWSGTGIPADINFEIKDNDKYDGEENCIVRQKHQAAFLGSGCSQERYFTCFDEDLVLVREKKTWEEASEHCRSLGGDDQQSAVSRTHLYDLVSLFDDDFDFARELTEEATTDEVWIGLRFLAGHWWWMNGEPMTRRSFQSCPTDGACGVLEKNAAAAGVRSCTERRNFLCAMRP